MRERPHMNHGAASSASGRKPSGIRPVFTLALIVTLGVLLWVYIQDPMGRHQMSVDTSLRETIYVTALALDAEFEATGAYPNTLEEVGMDEEGVTYRREDGGYLLIAEDEGVVVEYRSGEDLLPFQEAFEQLLPPHLEVR